MDQRWLARRAVGLALLAGLVLTAVAAQVTTKAGAQINPRADIQLAPQAADRVAAVALAAGAVRFRLNSVTVPYFVGFEQIADEVGVLTFRQGNAPNSSRELPGQRQPLRVVVKKDVWSPAPDFFVWWQQVRQGQAQPRELEILLYNRAGQLQRTWRYHNAWPCKWQVSSDDAGALTETITFAAEDLAVQ